MYVPKFTPTCYLPSADDEWGQVLDPAGDRIQVGARVAVRVFAPRLDNWGDPEWREVEAEVEAERDALRRLCLDAANYLDDLGTASSDTMAARLRAAGGER